jgi:hypothetical protein
MAKRFTDTDKWLKNNWFIDLPAEYKMLWLFILDSCDNIGVWEVNLKVASFAIGAEINKQKAIELFDDRIKIMQEGHKWWVVYFCVYQYGELRNKESNYSHSSYIKALQGHGLYEAYLNTLGTCSEEVPKGFGGVQDIKIKDNKVLGLKDVDVYTDILNYWNLCKIIKHEFISDKAKRIINGYLKHKVKPEALKAAIGNYAAILRSPAHYFSYKWTLQDFLQRGFDKFKDLEIAKANYAKLDKFGKPIQIEAQPKELSPKEKADAKAKYEAQIDKLRQRSLEQYNKKQGGGHGRHD